MELHDGGGDVVVGVPVGFVDARLVVVVWFIACEDLFPSQ